MLLKLCHESSQSARAWRTSCHPICQQKTAFTWILSYTYGAWSFGDHLGLWFVSTIHPLKETDNQALSYMTFGNPTGTWAWWVLKLQDFHFHINDRRETPVAHIDGLSRPPVTSGEESDLLMINEDLISMRAVFEVCADSYPTSLRWSKEVSQLQREDPKLKETFDGILRHEDWSHHYKVQDGVLFMKKTEGSRLVIPKSQRVHLLRRIRKSLFGRQCDISKTSSRIRDIAYWPGMFRDVKRWLLVFWPVSEEKS